MRTHLLRLTFGMSLVALGTVAAVPASAQRSFDRGRFDPSEWYGRMDANKNGQIDPDEVSERSRPFIEQAAKRAGLDPKSPLPISKLVESQSNSESGSSEGENRDRGGRGDRGDRGDRGRGEDRGRDESRSSSSSGGSSTSKTPGVPGFATDTKIAKAQGFDAPPPAATAAAAALAAKYDKRVIEMLDGMLKEYDRNRDDLLDEEEMKRMKWSSDPKESDTNKDGKLSRAELAERLAKRFQSSGGGAGGGSAGGGSSGGAANQQSEDYQRVKKYAESLLKQNDANSNGLLEKAEWAEVRSISKDTDTNNDGIVTLDELVAKLAGYGKSSSGSTASTTSSGSGGSPSSGGSSGSGSSSGSSTSSRSNESGSRYGSSRLSSGKPGDRKSYRTLTAVERLPKGLPDWFARNDADADGQIQMSEYTTSWTDAKAEEFAKYDLNGDGFITVSECLKAEPPKK